MKVSIWGMNKDVEIDEKEIRPYVTEDVRYKESYTDKDNIIYGYDESICAWVQLGVIE